MSNLGPMRHFVKTDRRKNGKDFWLLFEGKIALGMQWASLKLSVQIFVYHLASPLLARVAVCARKSPTVHAKARSCSLRFLTFSLLTLIFEGVN